jgi:CHAT domain-containing protein
VQIARLFSGLVLRGLRRGLRRTPAVGIAVAFLFLVPRTIHTSKKPPALSPTPEGNVAPLSLRGLEVLDFKKSQGVDLRPAGRGQILWVDLQAGEFQRLSFEQKNLDIEIAVFGPSGDLIFKADRPGGSWGPELVPLLAEETGRYRLEITGQERGVYRFTAKHRRKAREEDRQCFRAARSYFRGKQLLKQGRPSDAEPDLREALALWQRCGYRLGEADANYKLGDIAKIFRKWLQAIDSYSQALMVYQGLQQRQMQALILNEMGVIYYPNLGRPADASKVYGESLVIARQFGFRDLEARVLTNRSHMRSELGDLDAALRDAETALAPARASGKFLIEAAAENLIGRAYLLLGDAEGALQHHQQARKLLGSPPDPELWALTLVHFGDAYRILHDWDQSISSYLQAVRIWRQLGRADEEATALNNLGVVYSQTGRFNEARDTLLRVHDIYLKLGNRSGSAVVSINLAWILGPEGRYDEALGLYRESLDVFQAQGLRADAAVALFGMAWVERKRGNLNEARRLAEKALDIVESIRARAESRAPRAKFLAGWQDFYALMVDILMELHQREPVRGFDLRAFAASERGRCRTLLDSVEGRIVLPSLSWAELQKTLDRETTLLEYSLGEDRSYLWVVTSDSLNSYVLPGKTTIETLAREVSQRLAGSQDIKNRQVAIRKGAELSQILLGQVASRLDRKRLLIVAPPELQYISFAALPALPVSPTKFGEWPTPWLDRFEVIVEPSATFLASLRRLRTGRQPAPNLLAVVGAPVYLNTKSSGRRGPGEVTSFAPLRFSRREAESIRSSARGRATLFLGLAANPLMVLRGGLKSFQILHFSAHGLPVSSDPQESAIVLSRPDMNGTKGENRLLARDIARLDLPSDLVVLSACSTGLGTEIRGEGLVGLTQAFFSAGASRVAASLWNVDDLGTSELMKLFYYNLLQKKLSPSAALREAQLAMWRQERWKPPYYWAGFVLQGEWR